MEYMGTVVTGDVSYALRQDTELLKEINRKAAEHAARLEEILKQC